MSVVAVFNSYAIVCRGLCINGVHRNIMAIGFRFEVRWSDADVFDVRISGLNGAFGNLTSVYVSIGGLAEAAAKLEGFAIHPTDRRDIAVSGPSVLSGRAGPSVWLSTAKILQASACRGQNRVGTRWETQGSSSAILCARRSSAVDAFVEGLRRLEADREGTAALRAS